MRKTKPIRSVPLQIGLTLLLLAGSLCFAAVSHAAVQLPSLTSPTTTPPTTAQPAAPADPVAALKKKIDDLKPAIAAAKTEATPEHALQLGLTSNQGSAKVKRLQDLQDIYQRQITALNQIATDDKTLANLKAGTASAETATKPVKTISDLDKLGDSLEAEKFEADADQKLIANAEKADDTAKQAINPAQQALDAAHKALNANQNATLAPKLQWDADLAQISLTVAQATAALRDTEVQLAKKQSGLSQAKLAFLKNAYQTARQTTPFTHAEFESRLDAIEKNRAELKDQLRDAQKEQALNSARAMDAHADVNKGPEGGGDAEMKRKLAVMSMRDAYDETSKVTVTLLQAYLEDHGYLDIEKDLWKLRFDLLSGQYASRLGDARSQVEKDSSNITQQRSTLHIRSEVLQKQISDLQSKLANWQKSDGDKSVAAKELDALTTRQTAYASAITYLDGLGRLAQRITDEIDQQRGHLNIGQRLANWRDGFLKIWRKGYHSNTTRTTLTIGQVVSALLLFTLGIFFARRLTRKVRKELHKYAHLNDNAIGAIERIVNYALIVLFGLAAMHILEIPLTVFTLFGGALAIGVGFGAQNIINNFISGLILMLEQPIRIKDVVEVDGKWGSVENIGSRCSQLRLFDGVDILVPNSRFLESTVINWTLTDNKIRFCIPIGVAYGSPVREVARLLMKAVTDHGKVLKDPEPVVLFQDFGDNALKFEIYFWINMGPNTDTRVVRSDLRFMIDKLLSDAGIVIAFPQRDLHLDTSKPLEIRLLPSEPPDPPDHTPPES